LKVLIIGASGAVGKGIFEKLKILKELEIYGTYFNSSKEFTANPSYFKLDITLEKQLCKTIASGAYDFIIWLAGCKNIELLESDHDLAEKINVEPLRRYVECVERNGLVTKLIYISTDYVFEGTDGYYEDSMRAHPTTKYGESKLAAELVLKKSGVPFTCIRTSAVMTPGAGFNKWLLTEIKSSRKIYAYKNVFFSPTSLSGLAESILSVINDFKDAAILHFSGPRVSRFEFARSVCRAMAVSEDKVQGVDADFCKTHFCSDLSLLSSPRFSKLATDIDSVVGEILLDDKIY